MSKSLSENLPKLPIGYSSLEQILDYGCVYIDKTRFIYNLTATGGRYYFLSRPRRFGKSLFINTLKQAFLGNKAVFRSLYLENNWNWSLSYPVIHIDFGGGLFRTLDDLISKINMLLDAHYAQYDIPNKYEEISNRFDYLITTLHNKTHQQIVILIDEYDKPILDSIDNQNIAINLRETLKKLYAVIKTKDKQLRFVFFTEVSKFSQVSLFSGLNNLEDITLNEEYATICGYTQIELENAFTPYLTNVDRNKLRTWYNGYRFSSSIHHKVYNPFDILLFFANKNKYQNYWFSTDTPTFLIKLLQDKKYPINKLDGALVTHEILNSFDVDDILPEAIFYQAGYLTIVDTHTNQIDGTQFNIN